MYLFYIFLNSFLVFLWRTSLETSVLLCVLMCLSSVNIIFICIIMFYQINSHTYSIICGQQSQPLSVGLLLAIRLNLQILEKQLFLLIKAAFGCANLDAAHLCHIVQMYLKTVQTFVLLNLQWCYAKCNLFCL